MKRILVITPFFYPHVGGSERYMEELYVFLKGKHANIRVDVLCYNTDNVKEQEKYKGLNIYRIPCWTLLKDQFCLPKPLALFKFLKSHNSYNLVHSSTRFFDSSWWAPLYAKLIKSKVVLTDHCAFHPASNNRFINMMSKLIEMTIVRFSLHFYDEIYSESKSTREFLKKTFKVNSQLAYPGVGYIPDSLRLKDSDKKIKVVYVGRMIESKGVKMIFDIAREIPEADFVLAGGGSLVGKLKERVISERLRNVFIPGNLLRNEVSRLLKSADIFVYPSWHSEGLPLALIEAGSYGLPVVATDTGGVREVIVSKRTGILTKQKDYESFKSALYKLIKNNSLREKLGRNLKVLVSKKFSWQGASSLIIKEVQ